MALRTQEISFESIAVKLNCCLDSKNSLVLFCIPQPSQQPKIESPLTTARKNEYIYIYIERERAYFESPQISAINSLYLAVSLQYKR
jgi:hypothetical protein